MQKVHDWLKANHDDQVRDLANLVSIQSISTDYEHAKEIDQSAALVCEQMRAAGLNNVEVLKSGNANPYAYGEWLGAPGKPTVFLYSHHDVQPVAGFEDKWLSPPWTLTERDGRLYGRGSADDKGAVPAQLYAIASYLKTTGSLPVNVKVVCEGEEEVGSTNLDAFFHTHKDKLMSDVIVVCDTENAEPELPSITYSLRGIVGVVVEVETAATAAHSGTVGGVLPDPALALNVILSRLYWKNGKIPVPGLYDKVRKPTPKERNAYKRVPHGDEAAWRQNFGVVESAKLANMKNINLHEQTWRYPSVTIIAQEASSIKRASNQVLPKAAAIVSCRIVPDMDPDEVYQQLVAVLTKDPPWGAKVTCRPHSSCKWWMTDPTGPAFEAAMKALKSGYGQKPVTIGSGGAIGFVGPLAELFGGAPALLVGIEDPKSSPHAPNESLDRGIFQKLTASLAHLFENLGKLPDGKVKAEPKPAAAEVPAGAAPETVGS
jgi:acetylornithine deacetylase/succinyl-diaminopimelate desuccinylase-like protein